MWASTHLKSANSLDKKKKAALPLPKYLSLARDELVKQRKEAPQLKKEAENIKKSCSNMTKRWQYRMQKDALLYAGKLESEAELRESMKREHEYEQKIAPYLNAYNQRVEITENNTDAPRNITAPGAGKKRETIDTYVQQSDATALRQTTIVDEYLMEVSDAAPKLALHTRDDCPLCNETLMLVTSRAIMTCPKCGYAITYLDATMSSMSYSDDVEFSSFSYKRINHFNEWLQHVQAKENFEISDEAMQQIANELYKQRITSVEDITQKKVREVLKILKLRKAYEHGTSRTPPTHPPHNTVHTLFASIWQLHKLHADLQDIIH